ncbi:MAG: hypothetical protein HY874_10965 [Chloroflexi bacterium]|nr:hypothetical protein [Chloroflexota bacterium]
MQVRAKLALLFVAAVVAVTVACGGAGDAGDGATATPDGDRKVVLAPVDSLGLITSDSLPPQYSVRIGSGLPSGCARFNAARITGRTGSTIMIEVTNTVPSDENVACTAIYGTHEEVLRLDFPFKPGNEYVLRANEKELRFTAQ